MKRAVYTNQKNKKKRGIKWYFNTPAKAAIMCLCLATAFLILMSPIVLLIYSS